MDILGLAVQYLYYLNHPPSFFPPQHLSFSRNIYLLLWYDCHDRIENMNWVGCFLWEWSGLFSIFGLNPWAKRCNDN